MKKIVLLFLVLICNLFMAASARTWVQVDDNDFIDKDSIKIYVNDYGTPEYARKVFWVKSIDGRNYKDIEKFYNKKVSHVLSQHIVDYSKQTTTLKSIVIYDVEGQVISNQTFKDYELKWDSIAPNSVGELWAELVKKPRILKRMNKIQQAKNLDTINKFN